MPVTTLWIFIVFGLCAIVGTLGNILGARVDKVLESKGYTRTLWARPFRDLRYLRELIASEPDSVVRDNYIRLHCRFRLALAVAILLLIVFLLLGFVGYLANAH